MVFYLKYRPQKVSELDSEEVREKLSSVLSSKRTIPHAFLFTGPKGLGKTSAARILAKAINCTNRKPGEIEPCNKCLQCKSIATGANLDVLELDGASNRGIDEIRDLREKIRLSPVSAFKKVYIIDEVHMLTSEAFNALLKTLEEPPSHASFILCTTEAHKVPPTIVSRCFQINFPQAKLAELTRSLRRISKGENLRISDEALDSIANLSGGSFRDASKILEELARAFDGKKISSEAVEESYKITSLDRRIEDLVDFLSKNNLKGAISLINSLESSGSDARFFTESLISYLHKILMSNLEEESGKLSIPQIKELFELLSESYAKIKISIFPFLPLEIAVIEWCSSNVESQSLETKKPASATKASARQWPASASLRTGSIEAKHGKMLMDLIEEVKKVNHSVAGVLRSCSISLKNGIAVLETPYKFHKEKLDDKKNKAMLEKILGEMTGKKISLQIELNK
ncbi:MAG: DNA polymerase III subunit gamma/tau [Patescibacteria group bacterium]